MKSLDKTLTRAQFLRIVGAQLSSNQANTKDVIVLSKLYADVAGWKRAKAKPKPAKVEPEAEQTIDEMILKLEEESKNGQQHSERQGRAGQENESRAPHTKV